MFDDLLLEYLLFESLFGEDEEEGRVEEQIVVTIRIESVEIKDDGNINQTISEE